MRYSFLMIPSCLICCCMAAFAQQANEAGSSANKEAETQLTVRIIDMSGGKQITGLPVADVVGYPTRCSSDGTSFLELYDDSKQSASFIAADLYAISEDGVVTKILRDFPQNKKEIVVLSTFPGTDLIATLLTAIPQKTDKTSQTNDARQYYVSLSKRDGSFLRLVLLDLKFEPIKIAVLGSGRFVLLGVDTLNQQPVLALLDTDGALIRMLDLDARPIASSESLQKIYKKAEINSGMSGMTTAAAQGSNFVPYGDKVLFFQPGSDLPVHIIGNEGEEDSVKLDLPKDFVLEFVLPSPKKQTWIVRAQRIDAFKKLQSKGISVNPEQELIEADTVTGKPLSILHVTGLHPGEVTCALADKLIAPRLLPPDKATGASAGWVLAEQSR